MREQRVDTSSCLCLSRIIDESNTESLARKEVPITPNESFLSTVWIMKLDEGEATGSEGSLVAIKFNRINGAELSKDLLDVTKSRRYQRRSLSNKEWEVYAAVALG